MLAEDVIAPHSVPAHDNSAMDGYAVRAADLRHRGRNALAVVGTAFAGRPSRVSLAPASGAHRPAPPSRRAPTPSSCGKWPAASTIACSSPPVRRRARTCAAGEDLAEGRVAIAAGKRAPAELGLIASLGIAECACAAACAWR